MGLPYLFQEHDTKIFWQQLIKANQRKMKIIKTLIILSISISISYGQSVGINSDNSAPDGSAILDVKSTTKGILVPRMTSAQRQIITTPASGLLVFDTTTGSFWFYNNASWTNLVSSGSGGTNISDVDNDTKVEVELTPDDDAIRFTTSGVDMAKMDGTTLHIGTPEQSIYIGNDAGINNANAKQNVAIGYKSLEQNTSGEYNIAIGSQSLNNITTHSSLIAIGDSSLFSNGLGSYKPAHSISNIAVGNKALKDNTLGSENIGIGSNALLSNTDGRYNTALGHEALSSNTYGERNVAIGNKSLSNSIGSDNIAIGYSNMLDNTTGSSNISIGSYTLANNTTGKYNTAMGRRSLYFNTTGERNVGLGFYSLYQNQTGNLSIAIGNYSMYKNTLGGSNVALGTHALYENTIISNTVAIGDSALYNNGKTLNSGAYAKQNTAVGSKSLFSNDGGFYNTAVGYESLINNTSGNYNTGIGTNSTNMNATGDRNTALGYESLHDNVDGDMNVAIGSGSMRNIDNGNENVSIGASSLLYKISGDKNTAVGTLAGFYGSSGERNTFLGHSAGYRNQSGDNNTLVGYNAGRGSYNHSKSGSVMIGHEAGYYENSSNKLYIDNTSTSTPLIYGDFDTNALRVNGSLEIGSEYKLPLTDGTDGEVLITDGLGNLTWAGSTAGLWTDGSGTDISYTDGNVGIGISNPNSKLHLENSTQLNAVEIKHNYSGISTSNGLSVYGNATAGTGHKIGISSSTLPGSANKADGIFSTIWPTTGGSIDNYFGIRAYANGEATALKAYTNNANGRAALFEGDVAFTHFTGTSNQINISPANLAGAIGRSTIYLASDAQGLIGHKIENDSSTFRISYKAAGFEYDRLEIDNSGVMSIANDAFILDPNVSGKSRFTTDEIEIKGGSDLAEYFDINNERDDIIKGLLVSIDPDNPGKLKITDDPNCPLLAGVISGAEGIKPGMMMGQKGTLAFGEYPVTLTGRVYVKANEEGGKITPGDILTSSTKVGEAMKVENKDITPGTTIGKALTEVNSNGFVLALISLN